MGKRILTVGEPMGLLIAQEEGGLDEVKHFTSAIAGAEFNVAVGLTRLGHTVGYLTRVGRDPFGRQICRYMKQIGLDTGLTRVDQGRRTGFMLQSRTSQGDPDIYYFRTGSAASALSPADVTGPAGVGRGASDRNLACHLPHSAGGQLHAGRQGQKGGGSGLFRPQSASTALALPGLHGGRGQRPGSSG